MVIVRAGTNEVKATNSHPFFVERDSQLHWIEAGQLRVGDTLFLRANSNANVFDQRARRANLGLSGARTTPFDVRGRQPNTTVKAQREGDRISGHFDDLLNRSEDCRARTVDAVPGTFDPVIITDLTYSSEQLQVFNIEVEHDHSYVADGFVVHNCLSCLSLDGTLFPLTTTFMATHTSCRCSSRPKVSGVDDPAMQTGRQWFDAQPDAVKRQMVPVSAYDDLAAGRLQLQDFVHLDRNDRWGDRYRQASVTDARANAGRRGSIVDFPGKPARIAATNAPAAKQVAAEVIPEPTRIVDPIQTAYNDLPETVDKSDRNAFNERRQAFKDSLGPTGPRGRPDLRSEADIARKAIDAYVHPHGEYSYPYLRKSMENLAAGKRNSFSAQVVEPEAKFILKTLANSPPIDKPLYRGSFTRSKEKPELIGNVGDPIRLPGTASFSLKRDVADGFRTGTDPGAAAHDKKLPNHETTFIVEPGAQGIKVDLLSDFEQSEVITGGEFVITDVTVEEGKRKSGKAYTHTTYTLRQVAVVELE